MATLKDLRTKRDELIAHAREIADTATHAENQRAGDAVALVQKEMVQAITEGAKPCPICQTVPTGMEHPMPGRALQTGRFEYEVGCPVCRTVEHSDGTVRKVSARGGLMPKHTVELWNEGPDQWTIAKP